MTSDISNNDSDDDLTVNPNILLKNDSDTGVDIDFDTEEVEASNEIASNLDANIAIVNLLSTSNKSSRVSVNRKYLL